MNNNNKEAGNYKVEKKQKRIVLWYFFQDMDEQRKDIAAISVTQLSIIR